jgi:hypothetical protein
MNKVNCNIIKDILPLYIDNVICEDTKELVEEHLLNCDECKKELSLLKLNLKVSEVVITEKDDIAFLKKIGLDIRKKRVFTGILSAVISAIVVILSFAYLTAPEYLPYTESFDIITANENNGSVTLSFTGEYEFYQREQGVYDISLYHTVWNKLFNTTQKQVITVNPNGEQVKTIYYVSNGGQEDKIIYGENPFDNGGVVTLPRLFLNYYIVIATLITFVLTVLFVLFRKKQKIKTIIVAILLIPISYIVSHIMITGLNATSYSATRDFYLILLLVIPIYFMFYILYKKNNY